MFTRAAIWMRLDPRYIAVFLWSALIINIKFSFKMMSKHNRDQLFLLYFLFVLSKITILGTLCFPVKVRQGRRAANLPKFCVFFDNTAISERI